MRALCALVARSCAVKHLEALHCAAPLRALAGRLRAEMCDQDQPGRTGDMLGLSCQPPSGRLSPAGLRKQGRLAPARPLGAGGRSSGAPPGRLCGRCQSARFSMPGARGSKPHPNLILTLYVRAQGCPWRRRSASRWPRRWQACWACWRRHGRCSRGAAGPGSPLAQPYSRTAARTLGCAGAPQARRRPAHADLGMSADLGMPFPSASVTVGAGFASVALTCQVHRAESWPLMGGRGC